MTVITPQSALHITTIWSEIHGEQLTSAGVVCPLCCSRPEQNASMTLPGEPSEHIDIVCIFLCDIGCESNLLLGQ